MCRLPVNVGFRKQCKGAVHSYFPYCTTPGPEDIKLTGGRVRTDKWKNFFNAQCNSIHQAGSSSSLGEGNIHPLPVDQGNSPEIGLLLFSQCRTKKPHVELKGLIWDSGVELSSVSSTPSALLPSLATPPHTTSLTLCAQNVYQGAD